MSEASYPKAGPESAEKQRVRQLVASAQENLAQEQACIEASDLAQSEHYKQAARSEFDEVVRLTFRDVYTLARRLAENDADAEDVLQESYRRAWQGLPKFRSESEFSTWMYRIVANTSSNHYKKRKRHSHADFDDVPEKTFGISGGEEEAAENSMLQRKLQAALQSLRPNLRKVVVLRDIYDLTHADIAKELGISETAAKVRLHRARRKLREIMTNQN